MMDVFLNHELSSDGSARASQCCFDGAEHVRFYKSIKKQESTQKSSKYFFLKQKSGFLISRCPALVKPNSAEEQKLAMLLLHELSHGLLTLNFPDIMLEKQKHMLDSRLAHLVQLQQLGLNANEILLTCI